MIPHGIIANFNAFLFCLLIFNIMKVSVLLLTLSWFLFTACGESKNERKDKHEKHNRFEEVENVLYSKLHCDKLEINEDGGNYLITIINSEEIIDSNNTPQGIASVACMAFMNQLDEYSFENFQTMIVDVKTKDSLFEVDYDFQTIMYMSRLENLAINYIQELQKPDSSSLMKYFNEDDISLNEITDLVAGYKDISKQLGLISGFELTGIYFDNPNKPLSSIKVVLKGESNAGATALYHEFRFNPKDEESRINWINYTIGQMYLGY